MSTLIQQLRDFRLNDLPKITSPSARSGGTTCGLCGGPAGLIRGRHSGKRDEDGKWIPNVFVVPVECAHLPYIQGTTPYVHTPNAVTVAKVEAMIDSYSTAAKDKKKLPHRTRRPIPARP